MVGLRCPGASGRFGQRRILLERPMILFYFPLSLVDCDDWVSIQGQVTGYQIAHTR